MIDQQNHELSAPCGISGLDIIISETILKDFESRWFTRDPGCPQFDWTSCDCARHPPVLRNIMGLDLRPACRRQDFGYRSYRAFGQLDMLARSKIDRQFMRDVYDICESAEMDQIHCETVAQMFYAWALQNGDGDSYIDPQLGLIVTNMTEARDK